MFSQRLNDSLHMIDLKPIGIENFIASYVLRGRRVAIVETGPAVSIPNLLAGLREIGVKNEDVDYVAVSHIHIDHAGGAGTLLQHLPNAKLLVHFRGAPHLINPGRLWTQSKLALGKIAEIYGEIQPVPENRIVMPTDGTTVNLGRQVELKVLETEGHASHHMSFYTNVDEGIFTGDAAGIYINQFDVIIPTTPMPFHLELTLSSIEKLMRTTPKRLYYTHFGPANNAVSRLKAYAEQLKLWANIVSEGVKNSYSLETIHKRILEQDPSMNKVADFVKHHLALRKSVVNQSIQGFAEYFKKKASVDLAAKTRA